MRVSKKTLQEQPPAEMPEPITQEPVLHESMTVTKGNTKMRPLILVLVVAVIVLAGAYVFQKSRMSESAVAVNDTGDLAAKVSRHIATLPGETPTVATIQDAEMLRKQNPIFYKDAQNGDRLLIWSNQAVLYSPSRDILLAVLPVTTQPPAAAGAAPAQQAQPEHATIEVRNGSEVTGLGKTVASELAAKGFTVLPAKSAKSSTYPQTIIVKMTSAPMTQTLAALQAATHATIVASAPGESSTKGDILLILGADYQK